jgi:hypothetical protein
MKRIALALTTVLLALPTFAAAVEPTSPAAPAKSPVEIQTVSVAELATDRLVLGVGWKYVEQENLPRPKELSIIAVLQGVHGDKLTAKLSVPVPASGPIPLSAKITVPHQGAVAGGQDVAVTVSVLPRIAGISDGTSNIVDGTSNTLLAKKTATLHLAPQPAP